MIHQDDINHSDYHTYPTYALSFARTEVISPTIPIDLGGDDSFENRVCINDSTIFMLHRSLVSVQTTNNWSFYSFNLQKNLEYTVLEFPRENISSSLNYRFHGLFYHEGLFYTIGSGYPLSLIRFSPSLDWLEVRSLQIPILYETNSSTIWHKVGGMGIFNEILWVFLQGYRAGWFVTYNATLYGLSLDTFEVINQFPIERPFRFHGTMDENGIFWVYYYNDVVNGTRFDGRTLIGYNLTTQQIQAVITGDIHEYLRLRNPYVTALGRAFSSFGYTNYIISQNKVIFDETPQLSHGHFFNGFYLIPFH